MIRHDRLFGAAVRDHRASICVHLWLSVACLCLACCSTILGTEQPGLVTPPPGARDVFAQFANLLETLQKHYVDPSRLQAAQPGAVALREFVRALDAEADLLAPEEAVAAGAPLPAGICDFGVSLTISNDYPTVISARDGSPAQQAGLFTGDQIVAIDGQTTKHARLFDVNNRLRGPASSKVALRVLDTTGTERDVLVQRSTQSPQPAARLKSLGQDIAYYRLAEFKLAAVEKLQDETKRAQAQRAHALILDLRNSAGGTFDAAMVAARLFLPAKAEIVSLEYSRSQFHTTFVSDRADKVTIPMLLLVNGGTAAEAEVFAAALRDNKRARLVGSRTFGRGYLFSRFTLPDGSALSIPTAQYVPPSGRPFQAVGLTPDIVVELPRETERALASAGFGSFDWSNDRTKILKTDIVLARALELLAK